MTSFYNKSTGVKTNKDKPTLPHKQPITIPKSSESILIDFNDSPMTKSNTQKSNSVTQSPLDSFFDTPKPKKMETEKSVPSSLPVGGILSNLFSPKSPRGKTDALPIKNTTPEDIFGSNGNTTVTTPLPKKEHIPVKLGEETRSSFDSQSLYKSSEHIKGHDQLPNIPKRSKTPEASIEPKTPLDVQKLSKSESNSHLSHQFKELPKLPPRPLKTSPESNGSASNMTKVTVVPSPRILQDKETRSRSEPNTPGSTGETLSRTSIDSKRPIIVKTVPQSPTEVKTPPIDPKFACKEKCCLCNTPCHLRNDDGHKTHFCFQSHPCKHDCDSSYAGFCSITNSVDLGKSKVQIGKREKCGIRIPPYKLDHPGKHCHNETGYHYCTTTCPGCGYICQREHGHSGKHDIKEHGKLINSIFVSVKNENVNLQFEDKTTMNFYRGQSVKNFTCHDYCKRFGRGHFHYSLCGTENGSVCDPTLFSATGVKHTMVSKDYPNVDAITHEAYWDMIQFNDPCPQSSHHQCKFRNKYGQPCTRKVSHDVLSESDPEYVNKISLVAERFASGSLSPTGHHFETNDISKHHVIMIDTAKTMSATDVLPSLDVYKDKEFSPFLLSRYGAAFELALRYAHVRYKLNKRDTFSLVLFNTKKGVNIIFENLSLKHYYSILDASLLPMKLDQRTSYSPVLETCIELMNKYTEKPPVFVFMTSASQQKVLFKSQSSAKLEAVKKVLHTKWKNTEFLFHIVHIGTELALSEEIRDLLIVTKNNLIYHTNGASALPKLIYDPLEHQEEVFEGCIVTQAKSQMKMMKGTGEQERARLALEILETEMTYLVELAKTLEMFYYPLLLNNMMKEKEVEDIFSGLSNIQTLGNIILNKLETRIDRFYENPKIGDLFIEFAPNMKVYTTYIVKYEKSVQRIIDFKDSNPQFAQFLEIRRSDRYLSKGSGFSSFMIIPIQRIPRYKLFLENLLDLSPETHVDYNDTVMAIKDISQVADYLNDQINVRQKFIRMKQIASKLVGTKDIIAVDRIFISDFRCQEFTTLETTDCVLFLFNDILIHGLERKKVGENSYVPSVEKKPLKEILNEKNINDIHFQVKYMFATKDISSQIDKEEPEEYILILTVNGKQINYSFDTKEDRDKFQNDLTNKTNKENKNV